MTQRRVWSLCWAPQVCLWHILQPEAVQLSPSEQAIVGSMRVKV